MNLDIIAGPLGKVLLFIYNLAFHNYGLAIIIFTIIVRLAMLPLTLKQYKSSAKMQEIQPLINDINKRYKDDKEKLNQELMKVYQEHNYNPASGCLPMLVQMPIILSLYWVIIQPLKFLLNKPEDTITKLIEVASKGLNMEVVKMGTQKELLTMNYFNENQEALSQVTGLLHKSELIDFTSFLGLHLGKTATYQPGVLFGPEAGIYIPLLILVILATVTTYFSSKLSMPAMNNNAKNGAMGCSSNSMMYMGPAMTLLFSFQLPAGVILYWMVGYVVAIAQQLYINKYILKKNVKPALVNAAGKKPGEGEKVLESGNADNSGINKDAPAVKQLNAGSNTSKPKNTSGGGKKGGKNKKGGKKN